MWERYVWREESRGRREAERSRGAGGVDKEKAMWASRGEQEQSRASAVCKVVHVPGIVVGLTGRKRRMAGRETGLGSPGIGIGQGVY